MSEPKTPEAFVRSMWPLTAPRDGMSEMIAAVAARDEQIRQQAASVGIERGRQWERSEWEARIASRDEQIRQQERARVAELQAVLADLHSAVDVAMGDSDLDNMDPLTQAMANAAVASRGAESTHISRARVREVVVEARFDANLRFSGSEAVDYIAEKLGIDLEGTDV